MHISTFSYLLCASSVLSAPAALQVTNDLSNVIGNTIGKIGDILGKDKPVSYLVPAIPNPNARRDGHAALLSAYLKYKRHFSDLVIPPDLNITVSKISPRAGTATGTVAASSYQNDVMYLSPVNVGGQILNMDFDTGSSDLWVFSNFLSSQIQKVHKSMGGQIYAPSKTSSLINKQSWKIQYADGSGASGVVYSDTVSIGNIPVQKQAVELAVTMSNDFVTAGHDGLVGLAFSGLNQVRPNYQNTWMENVMPNLKQKVFTADLKHNQTGDYTWGAINSTKYAGKLTYTKLRPNTGWWHFDAANGIIVNGKQVIDNTKNPNGAVADTGSSLLLLSAPLVDAYYAQVPGAQYNPNTGSYIYPCTAKLPALSVPVGSAWATIPPQLMTYGYANTKGTLCFGGLQRLQDQSGKLPFIYGDVLLKSIFAVFDYGNLQFGFAPKSKY